MKRPLFVSAGLMLVLNLGICACPVAPQNTPTAAATALAVSKLTPLLACLAGDPMNDQSPCNTFASRGLESIYAVADFKTGTGQYMSANQMEAAVRAPSSKWTRIGSLLSEDDTLCAQAAANAALPVIAVMPGNPHGHIALVIPGEPKQSGTWGKLAPFSAGFLLGKPAQSYVGGLLSKSFGKDDAAKAAYYYRRMI